MPRRWSERHWIRARDVRSLRIDYHEAAYLTSSAYLLYIESMRAKVCHNYDRPDKSRCEKLLVAQTDIGYSTDSNVQEKRELVRWFCDDCFEEMYLETHLFSSRERLDFQNKLISFGKNALEARLEAVRVAGQA